MPDLIQLRQLRQVSNDLQREMNPPEIIMPRASQTSSIANTPQYDSKPLLTLIHINAQVKVFHWQTDSYSQHVALGEYYDKLNDLIDTFVESYQGKYCRINLEGEESFNIVLKGFHIAHLEMFLNEVCDFLCEILPSTFSENDSELCNIVDEMIAETDKLKYLLTLR
jgi:DNA-binding ferritin-like protein